MGQVLTLDFLLGRSINRNPQESCRSMAVNPGARQPTKMVIGKFIFTYFFPFVVSFLDFVYIRSDLYMVC